MIFACRTQSLMELIDLTLYLFDTGTLWYTNMNFIPHDMTHSRFVIRDS